MVIKYVSDPTLNGKVSKIMDDIIGEVVSRFNPKSIIIMGSLGRGEGIVSEDPDGNVLFHSDCEMIIYPLFNILKYKEIREFRAQIHKKYGIKLDLGGFKFTRLYLLRASRSMRLAPTIENYDLKYGSTVVYGGNALDKIEQIDCEDIPLWEGLRLVFNRMAELLELYSLDVRKSQLSLEYQQEVNYRMNKLVLAAQDLLLIRSMQYHTSYQQKNEIFQNIFPQEYKELYSKIPGFTALTMRATSARLGNAHVSDLNPFKLWDEVLVYIDEILRYILLQEFGISYTTYFEFREHFLSNPQVMNRCYRGLSPCPMYQNTKCMLINVFLFKNNLLRKQSTRTRPWFQLVYSAIPVLYFSTYRGGIEGNSVQNFVNGRNFRSLLDGLPLSDVVDMSDRKEDWNDVKRKIIKLWKSICYSCGE